VHNVEAPSRRLVRAHPSIGEVCRYYPLLGLNGRRVQHGTLYGHADLDAAMAQRLADDLDAIPQPHPGVRSCPAAFGAIDLLFFAYADGRQIGVQAAADGCPSFSNGARATGEFSPAFARYLRLLNHLVPVKRQRKGAASPTAAATSAG
jgi:hypothetical protein